jgi:hypothetical protein
MIAKALVEDRSLVAASDAALLGPAGNSGVIDHHATLSATSAVMKEGRGRWG